MRKAISSRSRRTSGVCSATGTWGTASLIPQFYAGRTPAQLANPGLPSNHTQYNILRILRGEGKPLPILEIASRTITVVPGITGLIDRLERAGFVHRLRCEKDRRVIYVALTDQGTKTLADLDEPLLALHRKLTGHLSQGDLKDLIRLLEKLREPWTASDE